MEKDEKGRRGGIESGTVERVTGVLEEVVEIETK
jgi:hypothetical protein